MEKTILLLFLGINSYIDYKKKKVFLLFAVIVFIIGLIYFFLESSNSFISVLIGSLLGVVLLLIGKVTRESIGYGDGIVIIVTGIYLGFTSNLILLFLSFLLCGFFSFFLIIIKKVNRKSRIPFIPFVFSAYEIMIILEVLVV